MIQAGTNHESHQRSCATEFLRELDALAADSVLAPALRSLLVASALHDDNTGRHTVRVGYVAEALGHAMGLDSRLCGSLRVAAMMHDVGKLTVPDAILFKPGRLTDDEMAIIRRHPEHGARILAIGDDPLVRMAATVAIGHHERFDGKGYPYGVAGENIPLVARIAALADCYDALRSPRCYRPAVEESAVIEWILGERARAFDPGVVDAFQRCATQLADVHSTVDRHAVGLFDDLRHGGAAGLVADGLRAA